LRIGVKSFFGFFYFDIPAGKNCVTAPLASATIPNNVCTGNISAYVIYVPHMPREGYGKDTGAFSPYPPRIMQGGKTF